VKYRIFVNVMPHAELLDPQGKAILAGLRHLEMTGFDDVRVGKRIAVVLEAENETAAQAQARAAAEKLLANPVIESFTLEPPVPTD
jgi:phosphoribosylformylglycinamidine synthase